MGLNDDVMSDIDDDITVVVDEDLPSDNLEEGVLTDLLKADTKVKIVSDRQVKVTELKDLEDHIASDQAIGKSLAAVAMEAMPSLLDVLDLSSFTKEPSQVNYQITRNHMRRNIGLEESALDEYFDVEVKQIMLTIASKSQMYIDTKLSAFRDRLSEVALIANNTLTHISESKDSIVPMVGDEGTVFVDIHTVDLATLDVSTLDIEVPEGTAEYIAAVTEIINSNAYFRSMFFCAAKDMPLEYKYTASTDLDHVDDKVTHTMICKFFNSGKLKGYVEGLEEQLNEMIVQIASLKVVTYETVTLANELISKGNNIYTFISNTTRLSESCKHLMDRLGTL